MPTSTATNVKGGGDCGCFSVLLLQIKNGEGVGDLGQPSHRELGLFFFLIECIEVTLVNKSVQFYSKKKNHNSSS